MFSTQCIQLGDDLRNFHCFSVQCFRNTGFKRHGYIFRLIRSIFRGNTENQQIFVVWLICRIFQFQTFMADVPQVTVTAVAVFCIEWQIDAVLFYEFQLVFTGLHSPYISHTPWSDNFQIRSQCFDTQFKTDLVISFTGSTVADRGSTFFSGDFHQTFGDSRTSHGSTQQIFVFVYGTCLYTRHDIFITELVYDIFDI